MQKRKKKEKKSEKGKILFFTALHIKVNVSKVVLMFQNIHYWYVPLAKKPRKGHTEMLLTETALTDVISRFFSVYVKEEEPVDNKRDNTCDTLT